MLAPYPEIQPNQCSRLTVDASSELYIEESGSVDGHPVLVLHDGPGGRSEGYYRRLFDAERYRIIQFDQRGCGRSTPSAEIPANMLADAVADTAAVLSHLHIDRAVVMGFGWGARVAVEFAMAHPEQIIHLLGCGYGCESKASAEWLFGGGAKDLFPDEWAELLQTLEVNSAKSLLSRVTETMAGSNELLQAHTAKAWANWLARISSLHVHGEIVGNFTNPRNALTLTKMGSLFFLDMFNDETVHSLPGFEGGLVDVGPFEGGQVKGAIIHGRYDAVSPLSQSFELHQRWPGSELYIVRNAGHTAYDPAMTDALLRIISQVADRLDGVGELNG